MTDKIFERKIDETCRISNEIKALHDDNEKYKDISLHVLLQALYFLHVEQGIVVEPEKLLDLAKPYTEEYIDERAKTCMNGRLDAYSETIAELCDKYKPHVKFVNLFKR